MKTSTERISVMDIDYGFWIEENEQDILETKELGYNPLFSIVVPVYNANDIFLRECIESVLSQTYENWELILVDDKSTLETVRPCLLSYGDNDKIKLCFREENGNISAATNDGIRLATGEFIGFLDNDDTLAPNALYEVAKLLNERGDIEYIYSDEDKLSEDGSTRREPFFKPDWSPDTLLSYNYCNHFSVYRADKVFKTGGLRSEFNGAQDYDFLLRYTEKIDRNKIAHITKVLYHWRESATSTALGTEVKPYVKEVSYKVREEALKRRKIAGDLEWIEDAKEYRIVYDIKDNPLVSIVILSKDNLRILRQCIDSIKKLTSYENYEIIVVDNGSDNRDEIEAYLSGRAKYIYEPMDFNFSAQCNIGARAAGGEYILLLNDDIEIIQSDWLSRLLGQAIQKHTGAVGAKLYYPDSDIIQHDGVVNFAPGPSHVLTGMEDDQVYYFRQNRLDYNYLGVTGACLLCAKEKYDEVGGLDESLPIAYNDVDFCMRLYERGYYNIVRNDVIAYHYESLSRGHDEISQKKLKRLADERKHLYDLHDSIQGEYEDPFYNKNLTQKDVDFSLNVKGELAVAMRRRLLTKKPKGKLAIYNMFIDHIVAGEVMKIEGWTTSGNFDLDENAKKTLLLKLRDDYIIETEIFVTKRNDIANIMESKSENTGFIAMIDSTVFKGESRDYQLGIKYEYSGKVTYCWSDIILELDEDDSSLGISVIYGIGDYDKKIKTFVESVIKNPGGLYFGGWTFRETDRKHNECYLKYLAYFDGKNYKKIKARMKYRSDIVSDNPKNFYALYFGFETMIPYEAIKENTQKRWYMVYEDLRTNEVSHTELSMSEYGL